MVQNKLQNGYGETQHPLSPPIWCAAAWTSGIVIHKSNLDMRILLTAGIIGLVGAVILIWVRGRSARPIVLMIGGLIMMITAGAIWTGLDESRRKGFGLRAGQSQKLVVLEGVVETEPRSIVKASGAMGHFDYRPPRTTFLLRVTRRKSDEAWRKVSAGVWVSVPAYDNRLELGDRVQCTGWLTAIMPQMNPGGNDFAEVMASRGAVGRLRLANRGNCEIIERARESRNWVEGAQKHLIEGVRWALRHDYEGKNDEEDAAMALLEALLIGDRRNTPKDLNEAFRRTGLAHLLAISGLHLSILAVGALFLIQAVTGRPKLASVCAIGLLLVYLVIVPPRVPVLRAGLMTIFAMWALTRGRRVSSISVMCLAGLVLLVWRPGDLYSAGFQLSFAVVTGLVLFTGRVANWMWPRPLIEWQPSAWNAVGRSVVNYLAVSLVAWLVAMPIVAYHFQTISPMTIPATMLALIPVCFLLWFGYLKILATAILPDLGGTVLGPVLYKASESVVWCVETMSQLPGVVIHTPAPSVTWSLSTLAVGVALMSGMFVGRRKAMLTSVLICVLWLFWPAITKIPGNEALKVNMMAVGNGSCYLLQSGGEVMVFDCGSRDLIDITTVVLEPAFRRLGVHRVDRLVISHPDIDHFSGALELVDAFDVQEIWVGQSFMANADEKKCSAAKFLLEELKNRHVTVRVVGQGKRVAFGKASLEVVWPPEGEGFDKDNDNSLMLSIRAAGRRVLLSGDIQQEAMKAMLDAKGEFDLEADVIELPHHGSLTAHVPAAPKWVAATRAKLVLQSSGFERVRKDRWKDHLKDTPRYITARDGMAEVTITTDGTIKHHRFLDIPIDLTPDNPLE